MPERVYEKQVGLQAGRLPAAGVFLALWLTAGPGGLLPAARGGEAPPPTPHPFSPSVKPLRPVLTPPKKGAGELKPLDYPADVHRDRDAMLQRAGDFALDTAYAAWRCPHCGKTTLAAVAPLFSRRPFTDWYEVKRTIARVLLKKPLRGSAPSGGQTPFRCPFCETPDFKARPDRIMFTHVLPETGDDLRICYTVKEGLLTGAEFFLVRPGKKPEKIKTPWHETDFQRRFGTHFSLRGVWREWLKLYANDARPRYEQVAPGMKFLFRPRNASAETLRKLVTTKVAEDRRRRVVDMFLSPCRPPKKLGLAAAGTWRDWARPWVKDLEAGNLECFVGVSLAWVRRAAAEVFKSRGLKCRLRLGKTAAHPGYLTVSSGDLHEQFDLAPLIPRAVYGAMSLHRATVLEAAALVERLDRGNALARMLRFRFFRCKFKIEQGRFLVATDRNGRTVRVDVLRHALLVSPDRPEEFDAFCRLIFPWDKQAGCFRGNRDPRSLCFCGLPAFARQKIRPRGFLVKHKRPQALFTTLQDADGKSYDLCYTAECLEHIVYMDPTTPRFKGLTTTEAGKLAHRMRGVLPFVIEGRETVLPPRTKGDKRPPAPVVLACGHDLASVAADEALASEAARVLGVPRAAGRLQVYALTTNAVMFSPRALTAVERKAAEKRLRALADKLLTVPGLPLKLHFDLPRVAPAGKVWLRR